MTQPDDPAATYGEHLHRVAETMFVVKPVQAYLHHIARRSAHTDEFVASDVRERLMQFLRDNAIAVTADREEAVQALQRTLPASPLYGGLVYAGLTSEMAAITAAHIEETLLAEELMLRHNVLSDDGMRAVFAQREELPSGRHAISDMHADPVEASFDAALTALQRRSPELTQSSSDDEGYALRIGGATATGGSSLMQFRRSVLGLAACSSARHLAFVLDGLNEHAGEIVRTNGLWQPVHEAAAYRVLFDGEVDSTLLRQGVAIGMSREDATWLTVEIYAHQLGRQLLSEGRVLSNSMARRVARTWNEQLATDWSHPSTPEVGALTRTALDAVSRRGGIDATDFGMGRGTPRL